MPDEDVARLERLLEWREREEQLARRREAAALREVEAIKEKLGSARSQLRACRECVGTEAAGGGELIDAHHCAARLSARVSRQRSALADARRSLKEAREDLAEAGRRRLAVQRMAATRSLRLRNRERATAQADLDESGRLRLLLEGDTLC
jgi:flagellar export protein FliJ